MSHKHDKIKINAILYKPGVGNYNTDIYILIEYLHILLIFY